MQAQRDDGVIREVGYGNNFGYVLEDETLFESTGYKFLQSQSERLFLPCMKILYNGKIQLFYITEEYSPLPVLLTGITSDLFINIAANILAGITEIRNNGFLSCQNIDISWDKIFVDRNTLKVKFVYLPLRLKQYGSYAEFENVFRSNLIKLVRKVFVEPDGKLEELIALLMNAVMKMEDIMENLFRDKLKSISSSQNDADVSGSRPQAVSSGKLVSVNGMQYFEIELDKKEIILGKKPGMVDIVIPFNEKISRKHCRIYQENCSYYILDENSTNGTYVNKVRVGRIQPVEMKKGDMISLANSDFKFV